MTEPQPTKLFCAGDESNLCTSCGAVFAPEARFCGACGAARGVVADRSAWRGFRAQQVWVQVVAWLFLTGPMVMFWIWGGSGWHVAGKIAATVGLLALVFPFMFA